MGSLYYLSKSIPDGLKTIHEAQTISFATLCLQRRRWLKKLFGCFHVFVVYEYVDGFFPFHDFFMLTFIYRYINLGKVVPVFSSCVAAVRFHNLDTLRPELYNEWEPCQRTWLYA